MESKTPSVSIIIPTYNRSEMLERAIQSIFRQTYKDFEILVIDDCSNDNTLHMLKNFQSHDFKIFRNNTNKGAAYSRNLGINNSRGKFIAFLDSDDEWLPTKLQKQINYFEKCPSKIGVVYCQVFDNSFILRKNTKPSKDGNIYSDLLQGWCPPTTSAFIIKFEALNNGIRFDEKLKSFQDYDLWIQLAKFWEFHFIPEPLVIFNHHEESRVSIDLQTRISGLEYFLKKWKKNIIEVGGNRALDFIRRKYLSAVYSQTILNLLRKHERKIALRLFRKLLETRKMKINFLIKFIILFTGNNTLIKYSRLVRIYFEKYDISF